MPDRAGSQRQGAAWVTRGSAPCRTRPARSQRPRCRRAPRRRVTARAGRGSAPLLRGARREPLRGWSVDDVRSRPSSDPSGAAATRLVGPEDRKLPDREERRVWPPEANDTVCSPPLGPRRSRRPRCVRDGYRRADAKARQASRPRARHERARRSGKRTSSRRSTSGDEAGRPIAAGAGGTAGGARVSGSSRTRPACTRRSRAGATASVTYRGRGSRVVRR